LLTINDRSKRNNFYFLRPKGKAHDKEVITNYPGELIQHDSSHHQFAPYADRKWYLITFLDDFSPPFILYAVLVKRETTWKHILALEYTLLKCCYRENIRYIKRGPINLVQQYNYRIVPSTTGEIPYIRFQRALREKRFFFREFTTSPPFKSVKDIFCLRVVRMVNPYRKVCINNLKLKVSSAPLHEKMQLRIIPDRESDLSEVRFWHES